MSEQELQILRQQLPDVKEQQLQQIYALLDGRPQTTMVDTLFMGFNLRMRPHEIPAFRGAVADMVSQHLPTAEASLFHNHNNGEVDNGKTYLYRYPRIQYQVHDGRAAIFAIKEGAAALNKINNKGLWQQFEMDGRRRPMKVMELRESNNYALQVLPTQQTHHYRICHYVPFTSKNYQLYNQCSNFTERIALLEKLLGNHLKAFADNMDWPLGNHKPLQPTITEVRHINKVMVLNHHSMAFDLHFTLNATLPNRMGLGRKPAFGFGWLHRIDD